SVSDGSISSCGSAAPAASANASSTNAKGRGRLQLPCRGCPSLPIALSLLRRSLAAPLLFQRVHHTAQLGEPFQTAGERIAGPRVDVHRLAADEVSVIGAHRNGCEARAVAAAPLLLLHQRG